MLRDKWIIDFLLQWRHNWCDGVSNHQPYDFDSTVYTGTDQRKHQSSASLAFVRGIHRSPVKSLHKWPVTRNMFPFDDVIMYEVGCLLPVRSQRRDFIWISNTFHVSPTKLQQFVDSINQIGFIATRYTSKGTVPILVFCNTEWKPLLYQFRMTFNHWCCPRIFFPRNDYEHIDFTFVSYEVLVTEWYRNKADTVSFNHNIMNGFL